MHVEKAQRMADTVKVYVDSDELECDYRKLPYAACIGIINVRTGKIEVWEPAARIPRGYRAAALSLLESVWDSGKAVI